MARYGRVTFSISYVVDLDDAEMVADARDCVASDVHDAIAHNEVEHWIDVESDATATAADIPDYLVELAAGRREHNGELELPADLEAKVQAIIDGAAADYGRDECVFDREVVFDDGCRMAIQAVVNNDLDGGWTQGVLFSANGEELGCTDPGDRLAGDYIVEVTREDGVHWYTATVAVLAAS